MTKCLRVKDGVLCIWEKPGAGDRFAPFDDPIAHFDAIRFDSRFQYLSGALLASANVNHAQVNGATGTGVTGATAGDGSTGSSQKIGDGQVATATHTLYTHSLGYVPPYMVLYDGEIVGGGTPVQTASSGRARLVSSYATSSIIGLRETGFSSASALSSVSRDYDVIVFREFAPDPALPLFRIHLASGTIILGQGKIRDGQRTLRRAVEGDATFYIPISRTLDVRNGSVRGVSPISGLTDLGPLYTGALLQIDAIPVTYDD